MKRRLLPWILIAALGLVACGKEEMATVPEPAKIAERSATPAAAVMEMVESLKSGRLSSAFLATIPPSLIEPLKAIWAAKMAEPVPEEDRREFERMMAELTAPGAEEAIYAKIEPDLIKFKETVAMQLPMYVGLARGFIAASVQQAQDLSPEQKAQALATVDAIARWVETAQFAEPALAKQAIGHLCRAARDLNLKTIDDLRALSFEQALERSDILFTAFKRILDTYGFRIDEVLGSVKADVVSQTGDQAKVRVSYQLFGAPLSFESEMVRLDGRWYGKESIERLKRDLMVPEAEEPAVAGKSESAARG